MFYTDIKRPLWPIAALVSAAHGVLIVLMAFFVPHSLAPIKPKEKLVVRTLKLEPKIQSKPQLKPEHKPAPAPAVLQAPPQAVVEPVVEAPSEPIAPSAEEPLPLPKPKIETAKKPVPKPVIKKSPPKSASKPAAKKVVAPAPKVQSSKPEPKVDAARKRKQEMLAKVQGTLSKIKAKGSNVVAAGSLDKIKLPSSLGELSVDSLRFEESGAELTIRERSYRDELASRLKLLLRFPEYGIVKLKLTLARTGKVKEVEILSSESRENKAHIQKTLPTLLFPPFGDNFGSEASHTFQITLSSD